MGIEAILRFLTDLTANNQREWFNDNKATYEQCKADFETISKQLIFEIGTFDDDVKHLEAKDCIFRIYRDTRFSHDKTPYKTHFGVFIASNGGRKSQRAGYYLHLDPAGSFIASGVWCPPPNLLKALRQSVYDNYDEFCEIKDNNEFKQYFNSFFEEDKLKKIPAGFDKNFAEPELLKLKHYLVEHKISKEMMADEADFVKKIAKLFKAAYPFNQFLNETVDDTI